jgi:ribokinase
MIVVVGSLNMDLVVPVPRFPVAGETLLGGDYARHPGGKGANQAVAAARAGGTVAMVGRVGADAFGAWRWSTAWRPTAWPPTASRRCRRPDRRRLHQRRPERAEHDHRRARRQRAAGAPRPGSRALRGARRRLLQLEVPLETTLRAARLGRAAGARVVLNLAPAQPLTATQLADVDVLLVNETEAAGSPASRPTRSPARRSEPPRR